MRRRRPSTAAPRRAAKNTRWNPETVAGFYPIERCPRHADPPMMEMHGSGLLPLGLSIAGAIGFVLFLVGGLRFRRWAVEDRPGIPRYSETGETIFLWTLYSGVIAFFIILIRQTLRQL